MKIRVKILFIVVPLLTVAIAMVGGASYLLAAAAVNNIAVGSLQFKTEEVISYAEGQWNILVDNNMVGNLSMESVAQEAVGNFSRGILRSPTEAIFALDEDAQIAIMAGGLTVSPEEAAALFANVRVEKNGFLFTRINGVERAAYTMPFAPFNWQVFVTEERSQFYGPVEQIFRTSAAILIGVLAAGVLLLFIMARYITMPIENVVSSMRRIIEENTLAETVPVYYKDEIGHLSHTFNIMLQNLDVAYKQIKNYAFDAAIAQRREWKIRNVFQLYVPADVIDEIFVNPEKMLIGTNRETAILFSDIRSFTTISEKMQPDDLVNSLNRYFKTMVNIIMDRDGIVDKYIGDAIMAIFGAPVARENDALSSVLAGLEMSEALTEFNMSQTKLGAPEFHIGIGVNYGVVTVGNIGCERKMNYTVIGDSVNLASRLEGLTKMYKEPILFSESVYEKIQGIIPCRTIDRVAVKGKTLGALILTARRRITPVEQKAWKLHEHAVQLYYERNFGKSLAVFEEVRALLPNDLASDRYIDRCKRYIKEPPPEHWDGVEIMREK
ncbi:MAG: HAMP domain-containing protein [Treponema sp.]|jgi:class 3 adenylate cyclase/HAMP domain-containing protein|nr:HAMP domain-containing protein [Treponema sp.]